MTAIKKILRTPLRISIAILLLGMLTKILQWPYAIGIIFFGFLSLGILYTLRFRKKQNKEYVDYVKLILVLFWSTNGILRVLDFPYTLFFQIMTAITFIIWFVMEGTAYFLNEDRKGKNNLNQILWNCIMVIGTLAIIAGSLFKILEWAYAVPVLIFGIICIVTYILKDFFFVGKNVAEEDENNEGFLL